MVNSLWLVVHALVAMSLLITKILLLAITTISSHYKPMWAVIRSVSNY